MKKKEIVLLILVILLDQISKIVVDANMNIQDSINIIPGFFKISYVLNTGAAWSMFEGQMLFFGIVTIIALVVMIGYFMNTKKGEWITRYGLILMIGGTIGNFIDRLLFQHVRDFLDFIIFGYDFPVFNIADMALCIGVGLLILSILLDSFIGGSHVGE